MNGVGLSIVQKEIVADFKARAEVHAERLRQISAQRNEELRKLAAYDDLVAALKDARETCEDAGRLRVVDVINAALRKAGVE